MSRRQRRRLLPVTVSTLALAATASVIAMTPGSASAAVSFGASIKVSDANASEPGIDVAPDGTVYINAPVGILSSVPGSPSLVWRSDNRGASWKQLPASLKANLPG